MSTHEPTYSVGNAVGSITQRFSLLKSNWKSIFLIGLIGAFLGLGYSFINKPTYMARVNFVIEESKPGAGGLFSALAGQIGMDLGSLSGMTGILAGDNVLEILKSPTLLKKVLLSPLASDTTALIAQRYAEQYGKSIAYAELAKKQVLFEGMLNRTEDSLLNVLATRILEKELSVFKPDRKLSVFRLELSTRNEELSQLISMRLLERAADLYIDTKTKRLRTNVDRLQAKADSIAALLNIRTETSASKDIINQNPSYVKTEVDVEISNREKGMLSVLYGDLNKSIDLTRTALIQETPTIEIIDAADLPLKKQGMKWYTLMLAGFLVALSITVFVFLWFSPTKN